MPYKLQFQLAGEPPAYPYSVATGLRAVAFGWICAADAALAKTIHDANQSKPLSISPLWTVAGEQRVCLFEIAVLADSLLPVFLEGIQRSSDQIRLGNRHYTLTTVDVVAAATWQDLLAPPASGNPEFEFEILSPAAHHMPSGHNPQIEPETDAPEEPATAKIRKSIVLPTPELYFGSYLGRWNVCCETKISEDLLRLVEKQVAVRACQGATQQIMLDRNRLFIGFEGYVCFEILKPTTFPAEARHVLTALARFATFTGTGVDTMRGMGQTRFLEHGHRDRPRSWQKVDPA